MAGQCFPSDSLGHVVLSSACSAGAGLPLYTDYACMSDLHTQQSCTHKCSGQTLQCAWQVPFAARVSVRPQCRHHRSKSEEDLPAPEVSVNETHTSFTKDILSGLKSLVAPVAADPSSANVYIPAREGEKHGSVFRRVSSMRPPSLQITAGEQVTAKT